MNLPLVSVCIPSYNYGEYTRATINSVLAQSYPSLEIIVQDDCSTDGTWEMLQELAGRHCQISLMQNEKNLGMSANWNTAFNRANGEYIMHLGADDLLESEFLSRCIDTFVTTGCGVVTTNHYFLRNDARVPRRMKLPGGVYENFAPEILRYNPFSINFSLFSRDTVRTMSKNGRFFTRLYTCDLDLWLALGLSGIRLCYLDEFLGTFRLHGGNLSQRQKRRMLRHTELTILRHRRGLKASCGHVYRGKLCYLLLKSWYAKLRGKADGTFERRLRRILLKEICS